MMTGKQRLIPIVLVIVGLASLGVWWLTRSNGRGDDSIIVSGNVELTEVKISFKTPGRLVELLVDEGDAVKKGMTIARLDQEQLLHQSDRDRATLAGAESQYQQLQTAIEQQRETVKGQISQWQAELSQAEAHLRKLLTGSRPQEIQQAQAIVQEARTQFEWAKKEWERAQVLYKNEDISTSQYDQFKARYDGAAATLKRAEENAALVVEGPRREDIDAARALVERAKAGLQLTEASKLELKRREQELGTRRADIDRARAQVAIIGTQLDDAVAVSSIDGVVLEKSAEVGETLAAGATVVTVGDWDHPWIRGYINEQDLGRVKIGAKVKVKTDSFPDKVYWGRVSFISSEAEFTPKQIQTYEERVKLVYRIKIEIENPQHELKSNMPVDAEIVLNGQ
jgi:HlyD family secretion protein